MREKRDRERKRRERARDGQTSFEFQQQALDGRVGAWSRCVVSAVLLKYRKSVWCY